MTEEIEIPDGAPGVDDWVPWHPREVAARLGGVPVPWHVVGGWALDLWHGRATRDHEDLEIAVPRARFSALRPYLNGLTLYTAGDRRIIPLPEQADPPAHRFQVWVCDPAVRVWRMDIFLEPGDDQTWICRRDGDLSAPYADIVDRTPEGVPYLRPEAVLLYKAKLQRPKDVDDFARALPRLSDTARRWLADALHRAHPGHPWRQLLDGSAGVGVSGLPTTEGAPSLMADRLRGDGLPGSRGDHPDARRGTGGVRRCHP